LGYKHTLIIGRIPGAIVRYKLPVHDLDTIKSPELMIREALSCKTSISRNRTVLGIKTSVKKKNAEIKLNNDVAIIRYIDKFIITIVKVISEPNKKPIKLNNVNKSFFTVSTSKFFYKDIRISHNV